MTTLRGPVWVGGILAVLAAAYWPTVRELSGFGTRDDGQFLIVFCAFAALVWGRRRLLQRIPVQPFWPGLAGLLALAILWLIGEIAFVRIVTDTAVVLMVPMAILAVCGVQWAKALAFPLAFLALAIPFEQPVAPILAEWTASVTIHLLQAVGIAVERQGIYFTIPSGRWVVADACGGVKYLTSCLIVAVLLAPALFDSTRKRASFVLGALALAIAGNWLRAFLTVLGAHVTNNQILRDDHSTFGWFVYAILFVLYCAAWWRFRDEKVYGRGNHDRPRSTRAVSSSSSFRLAASCAGALGIALSAPMGMGAMSAEKGARVANKFDVPEGHGWTRANHPATEWRPELQNAASTKLQTFQKDGCTVDLFIGLFPEERRDAKLVSVANRLVDPGTDWALASHGVASVRLGGRELNANRALIAGPKSRVVAWQWYWVDGAATGSGLQAKLAQLRNRLANGRQESAWITISVPADGAPDSEAGLRSFLAEMGPAIEQTLAGAFRVH